MTEDKFVWGVEDLIFEVDNWEEVGSVLAEPACFTRRCKHFVGTNVPEVGGVEKVVCVSFPEGIPDEIAYGDNLHIKSFLGDNGIQYEKEKK